MSSFAALTRVFLNEAKAWSAVGQLQAIHIIGIYFLNVAVCLNESVD